MRRIAARSLPFAAAVVLPLLFTNFARAQDRDVTGARDYPGIGRFGGSIITGYQTKDFDAVKLQTAPFRDGKASDARTVEGRVVSNKMSKTVTVLLERQVQHPLYGKIVRRSTKVHAHDENGQCKEGDTVRIVECAPLSKTKNWRVVEVVAHAAP